MNQSEAQNLFPEEQSKNQQSGKQYQVFYKQGETPSQKARSQMESNDIFSYEKWKEWKIYEQVTKIHEWKSRKSLYIAYTGDNTILYKIIHIKFTTVTFLKLAQNKIQSLEMICRLHAPLLAQIIIWSNPITRVDSLRKAHFPMLKRLSCDECLMQNLDCLSQVNSQEFGVIQDSRNHGYNVNWVAKLKKSQKQPTIRDRSVFKQKKRNLLLNSLQKNDF